MPSAKPLAVHGASSGASARGPSGATLEHFVEMATSLLKPGSRGTRGVQRDEWGTMREFVQAYSSALDQTRRTGTPVRITIDVQPTRPAEITTSQADTTPHVDEAAELEAALVSARDRGRSRAAEILNGPEMLSADAFAEVMGVTRATVNTRRQNRHLLGLEGAKRGFRFPRWQIGKNGETLPALPQLFELLGDSPWAVYRFLVQHHPEAGGLTGREALQGGRIDEALAAAENAAEAFA